jgi:hypothetical protein
MRLMIAGQGEHVTQAVEAGDEGGRLQVPQTQLLVIATADHPLTVWRNRNAFNKFSVATWNNRKVTKAIGECVRVEWQFGEWRLLGLEEVIEEFN